MTDPEPLTATLALVAKASAGDREALADLYRRHYERVRRVAALSMGRTLRQCEADIDDVVHDAFADAFASVSQGKFECRGEGSFRRWLATIVVNKVRQRGRRAGARDERSLDEAFGTAVVEPPVPTPERGPATSAGDHEVQEALLALDEADRTVITLRHVCGMSWPEIVAETGMRTERQAAWAVQRAMQRLRERLGRSSDDLETGFRSL
ncbi:MAG: sigma-70 family RNA polymerase sigma factor [Planctomycetes bacterium]|nr:sigma-70 family RNA polymerase sigma factor [Planctomycetota bacterium]MCB9870618.1 sigma-70 family RNA polymerase sigma factor [Planctomycetota bacterium]MCB9889485.1 sigma-70 family RNA polymerase sigma factor [Planctomycetota bacterium]